MHEVRGRAERALRERVRCFRRTSVAVRSAAVRSAAVRVGAVLAAGVLAWPGFASAKGLEGFLVGLNGVLTGPLDPVRHVVEPLQDYGDFPGYPTTGRVLGLVSGTLLGTYRIATGLLDVALTPLLIVPNLSPEPKIELVVIGAPESSEAEGER